MKTTRQDFFLKVVGAHVSQTLGTDVFAPPKPASASYLMVQALTQNIRYRLDGGVPTASVGFQLLAGDAPLLIPMEASVQPNFIREASGAILQFQWFE